MPKARLLRPDFWTDERVVSVSPLARLLFQGMWNYACDNGHLDDSAIQLKMRILPADNCDVGELIDELLATGMVIRTGGCIKVVNLPKQQSPDLRFLVFCDHCQGDSERHYRESDKPSRKRAPAEHPKSALRAPAEHPKSARRSVDVDVDVDVDSLAPPATGARKRGTRLPEGFTYTDEMATWASSSVPGVDLSREHEKFCDYWHSASGAKGVKLDWVRTWRNWMRTADERLPAWKRKPDGNPVTTTTSGLTDADYEKFAQVAATMKGPR